MSVSIDTAFVKQYESEVHMAYQRMGSKLRNTVRNKTNVKGADTTFQKVGKGEAAQKSRHGNVPTMSLDHTQVECTLADYYAADYIDKLDELKTNHDERGVVTGSAAGALGRKSDTLIADAMEGTSNATTATGGLTMAKIEEVREFFGENDVPDDGDRYFAVAVKSWTDLMNIAEFKSSDYVGHDQLPYANGMTAKRWMGFMFFEFNGLDLNGSVRDNFAYHKTAVGHASGSEVVSEVNYVPEKAAHFFNSFMSQGACLIDETGVYNAKTTE